MANDRAGCNAIDTSHALTVNYVHARSAAAASLAQTMADILTSLRAQRDLYVAQGSVTASELSALQSNAYDQLRAACDCNLSAFPDEVRGMFDAWLASELAEIDPLRAFDWALPYDEQVFRLDVLADAMKAPARVAEIRSHLPGGGSGVPVLEVR